MFLRICLRRIMSPTALMGVCLAMGLTGSALAADSLDSVSSLAGIYSSAHFVTVDGVKQLTYGFVEIDSDGRISAYEQNGEGPHSIGSGCYVLASGTATNTGLQSHTLSIGTTPHGDAAYVTDVGDGDMFGILPSPGASGNRLWYFFSKRLDKGVSFNGTNDNVVADYLASYAISFPAVAHPTHDELQQKLCARQ